MDRDRLSMLRDYEQKIKDETLDAVQKEIRDAFEKHADDTSSDTVCKIYSRAADEVDKIIEKMRG